MRDLKEMRAQLLTEKPWGPFLAELDAELPESVALHCVGGFVLKALYDIPRFTGDLDYLGAIPSTAVGKLNEIAGEGSAMAKKHRVFIQFTGAMDMPENYEDRLADLRLGFKNLRLLVPDPYDLLLSKLTRNSPKDREDVKFVVGQAGLNFSILQERFDVEMKPWIANVERHALTLRLWGDMWPRP